MVVRKISYKEIEAVLSSGEIIEDYPNDQPYPNKLILKIINERPNYVVVGRNEYSHESFIITVYLAAEGK